MSNDKMLADGYEKVAEIMSYGQYREAIKAHESVEQPYAPEMLDENPKVRGGEEMPIELGKKHKVIIERKILDLDRALFNEAAKPPYEKQFRMTDLGNMLFTALEKAGLKPLFRAATEENPIPFSGIEINVATTVVES